MLTGGIKGSFVDFECGAHCDDASIDLERGRVLLPDQSQGRRQGNARAHGQHRDSSTREIKSLWLAKSLQISVEKFAGYGDGLRVYFVAEDAGLV